MKFALIGDHPDGLDIARALAATGRHQIETYSGPAIGWDAIVRAGIVAKQVVDIESVLSDPEIDAVIVAASKASRAATLRRAVQSERHVLCVHPADSKPDVAFETALMQGDTGCVVLPLLPEAFHPGVARFAQRFVKTRPEVLEVRRAFRDEFWLDFEGDDARPGLPGWDTLRRIGGELVEVAALAAEDEPTRGRAILVSGKFTDGKLVQMTLLAGQSDAFYRISAVGPRPLTLVFADGWPGEATLTYEDDTGALRTETWPALPPWTPLIEAFEQAAARRPSRKAVQAPGATDTHCWTSAGIDSTVIIQAAETLVGFLPAAATLGWTDEIRALELDDNIRRSLHYRRAYALDLQDATEDATFKGTMTLVGCSLMWIILVLLFLSIWIPWLGWLIFPALAVFLALQFLRGVVKDSKAETKSPR
jgi:hypothetical protein